MTELRDDRYRTGTGTTSNRDFDLETSGEKRPRVRGGVTLHAAPGRRVMEESPRPLGRDQTFRYAPRRHAVTVYTVRTQRTRV